MAHFENYRGGFGTQGTYIGHWKEDVTDTARRLLESFRGKRVMLEYDQSALVELPECRYNQRLVCKPIKEWIDVPVNGNLDGMLGGVLTDNILIRVKIDRKHSMTDKYTYIPKNQVYEIQRLVIGDDSISELSIW